MNSKQGEFLLEIDGIKITSFLFGTLKLDGGAMFGSAPKNIWSKLIPADEQNRIHLAMRSLLIEYDNKTILVDAGSGDKWDDKYRAIYSIESIPVEILYKKYTQLTKVTDVILTHLHFDHAAGITRFSSSVKNCIELTYPNAVIHLQKKNYAAALNPGPKEKASYLKDHVEPLQHAKLSLIQEIYSQGRSFDSGISPEPFTTSIELFPKIHLHCVNGHTEGMQIIEIRGKAASVFFLSDLIPTRHHLHSAFHMGYDMCAHTVLNEKAAFFEFIKTKKYYLVFQHDISCAFTDTI
jgi:glyoxylase-like metal-dependent hydrolase (beta-lactamase superfamily II)